MNQGVTIRNATPDDARAIVSLIGELAQSIGEASPVSDAYARIYLAAAGSGILLAEESNDVLGLLSYSIRPNLYHAGPSGLIEELVVRAAMRGRGIGKALLAEALRLFELMGCAEASVSTTRDNEAAQHLYRSMGMIDEAVLLEKHFGSD
jgi:ribosomal protein S18 acetylase RimI-like enzyme